jgi:hypothetical protein
MLYANTEGLVHRRNAFFGWYRRMGYMGSNTVESSLSSTMSDLHSSAATAGNRSPSFMVESVKTVEQLCKLSESICREIRQLHHLIHTGVVGDMDFNDFVDTENRLTKTLIQKKYALLDVISTLQADFLDPQR